MLYKKAFGTFMSYDTTDAEKMQAEKALSSFNICLKLLSIAEDHLNIMAVPFKDHPDIPQDQILEFRAALRRFRDKCIDNFNNFKIASFKCTNLMRSFSSDTQTAKLMKSFIASIDDIEKQVNDFSELFNNLKAADFMTKLNATIDILKKEMDELKEIIDNRIKSHIQSNILGKSWIDEISNQLEMKLEKKTPLILDLNRQRQEILNGLEGKQKE